MRTIYTLTFLLLLSISALFSQSTLYVNQNISGGIQDGSNWDNAFPDLQLALAVATDGDAIWVAAGTYFPTAGADRSISFVLKQGVRIMGGFVGTETVAAQRDFLTNETRLSGNIGFPQGSDNSFHVLRGEGLDSTTVVDGFVISHGIADSPGEHGSGGGLLLTTSAVVLNTCPLIQNCRFEQNYAVQGGAISFDRNDNYYVNPIIRSCQFYFNWSATSGGAISKTGNKNIAPDGAGLTVYGFTIPDVNTPPLSAKFEYCIFEKNEAFNGNGAAYFIYGSSQINLTIGLFSCKFIGNLATTTPTSYIRADSKSNVKIHIEGCEYYGNRVLGNPDGFAFPIIYGLAGSQGKLDAVIKNCLFSGNGGGISSVCSSSGGKMTTLIDNCTFHNNSGLIINKSFYLDFDGITKYVRTTVRNCVIWEPTANLWSMFSDNNLTSNALGGYNIDHCLLSLDSFAAAPSPVFGYNNITHHDPLFVDVAAGDLRLQPCSPAVNAGDNVVVDTLNLSTDLDGSSRIMHGIIDMGAYETPDSCFISGSNEPDRSNDQAILFPNPVWAGCNFEVVWSGFTNLEAHWKIWDTKGCEVSRGTDQAFDKERIRLPSPSIPGFYFLKLWDGDQTVVIKVMVQG